jgi:hypothetical protein
MLKLYIENGIPKKRYVASYGLRVAGKKNDSSYYSARRLTRNPELVARNTQPQTQSKFQRETFNNRQLF